MKVYHFYNRADSSKEPIFYCKAKSRLYAAEHFAEGKRMPLKQFLSLFSVSK
jgi:hypothetical protein